MAKYPERARECLYYLAVGYYRLNDYSKARENIMHLLHLEPENQQALSLQRLIEGKASREGIIGMVLVGGAAAAAIGVLFAVIRGSNRQN